MTTTDRVACVNLPHVAAALEARDNRQLVGRPMVIEAPLPGPRTVFDLSPAAHTAGIRRGMGILQARKACPDVTVIPARPETYRAAFQATLHALSTFTDLVEPKDLENSWLAATGLLSRGSLEISLAEELATRVRNAVGLEVRVGLAHGKETSRIVAHYLEGRAAMVLPPGREVPFLGGLPVGFLPLDNPLLRRLTQLGLTKIAQYAALPSPGILARFGYTGLRAYRLAHGHDEAKVRPRQEEPYFEARQVLLEPLWDREALHLLLTHLAGEVAKPLTRQFAMAGSIRISVTLENGRVIHCRRVLDEPAVNPKLLVTHASALLANETWEAPLENVTLGVQGLCPTQGRQLELFRQDALQRAALEADLRLIQGKYGSQVVQQGHLLEPDSLLLERRAYTAAWGAAA